MFTYYPEQNSISSSLLSSIVSGFTTRDSGDMRKIQTIKDFFKENEISPRKIVLLEQIHSINVSVPDDLHLGDVEILEESDGVITKEKALRYRYTPQIAYQYYFTILWNILLARLTMGGGGLLKIW